MKGLIAAILFITILPFGKSAPFDPKKMVPFFPVVGLLLGMLVAVVDQAALRLWPPTVAALLDVIVLIIMTGAFHLAEPKHLEITDGKRCSALAVSQQVAVTSPRLNMPGIGGITLLPPQPAIACPTDITRLFGWEEQNGTPRLDKRTQQATGRRIG